MNVDEQLYSGNFPNFEKPMVTGYFSLDGERKFHSNTSQLKYIHNPNGMGKVKFDLDRGALKAIKKDDAINEKLDNLLSWILLNSDKLRSTEGQKRIQTDFVCYRGLLTTLMNTLYERQEGWIICATKWQGTIYMCAFETEEKRQRREAETPEQKKFSSWGYKFEQFMTKESPGSLPDTTSPVNEREEFCVTYRTRLDQHYVLFGAEMDGIRGGVEMSSVEQLSEAEFVELKTSRHIQTARQNQNFQRYKLLKWWSQSFLVGIKCVICGFRDDYGIVHELSEFNVKELPRMAKGKWDPCACMNFCASFLSFAKKIVKEHSSPDTVWKFEWKPSYDEVCYKEIPGPSKYSFLPTWYTDSLKPPA